MATTITSTTNSSLKVQNTSPSAAQSNAKAATQSTDSSAVKVQISEKARAKASSREEKIAMASANLEKQAAKLAEKAASPNISDRERQKLAADMQSINGAQKGMATMRGGASASTATGGAPKNEASGTAGATQTKESQGKAAAASQNSKGDATATTGQTQLKSRKYGIELTPRESATQKTISQPGAAGTGGTAQTTETQGKTATETPSSKGEAVATTGQTPLRSKKYGIELTPRESDMQKTASPQGASATGTTAKTAAATASTSTTETKKTTQAEKNAQSSSLAKAAENLNQKNEASRAALNNLEKAYGSGMATGMGRLNLVA